MTFQKEGRAGSGPRGSRIASLLALGGRRQPGQVVLGAVMDERIRLPGFDRGGLRRDFFACLACRQPRQVVFVAVVVEGGGGDGICGDSRHRQRYGGKSDCDLLAVHFIFLSVKWFAGATTPL